METPKKYRIQLDMTAPTVTASVYGGQIHDNPRQLIPQIVVTDNLSGTDPSLAKVTLDGNRLEAGKTVELYKLALGSHKMSVTASDYPEIHT